MQMKPPRPGHAGDMGSCLAIFSITEDRRADRGAMGAQLVRPSGNRHQGEPARPVSGALDNSIIGDRIPAFVAIGADALASVAGGFGQRQVDPSLPRRRARQWPNRSFEWSSRERPASGMRRLLRCEQ